MIGSVRSLRAVEWGNEQRSGELVSSAAVAVTLDGRDSDDN
jgi:hypothetical protein